MKTCATTAHRQKWWFLLLSVLVARATCIWLFCKRMTNRAGELHRGHEPEGHISNLTSLLYGTRTKLFHIGFVSFRGLKYTTHVRFRGNFPYEWGSSKSRMLKEGSRLPRHSKIPLKSLMRWSRKPFLSSNILQNYKTSVFWRETILSVMVSWFQLFLATKRDRGLYKPFHVSTINYCLHSSQSCVEIIQIWTIAFFQFLLLTFKAMNLVNNSW